MKGEVEEDNHILVKFFENNELLEESYFQKGTKASALFEFIGRDDIYLEDENISLSPESCSGSLEKVFKNKSNVFLNIIPVETLVEAQLLSDNKNQVDSLDTISITDSPIKASTRDINFSCENEVIVISDSPVKAKNMIPLTVFSSSSSEETDISNSKLSYCKPKRKHISSSDDSLELIKLQRPKRRKSRTSKPVRVNKRPADSSSDSDISKSSKRKAKISNQNDTRSLHPTEVEKLPFNINGNVAYKLKYDKKEGQKMKSSQDGRPWKRYNKSYTHYFKPADGKRLRANCKGSLICSNESCPFKKFYKSENRKRIIKEGNENFCEDCNHKMIHIECSAIKIWEFPSESQFVNVYHFGNHTCVPVEKPEPPVEKLKSLYEIDSSFKPCEVSSKLLMKSIEAGDSRDEIENLAFNLSDETKARNLKQSIVSPIVQNPGKRLFDLQQKCLETYQDPYLLYKFQVVDQSNSLVISSQFDGKKFIKTEWSSLSEDEDNDIYVLKSSKEKLSLLLQILDSEDIMSSEYVYMDFKENRIKRKGKNLKTLGLSVYHVLLKKVIWLVRMDCEKEDQATVSFFLNSIDSMVKHISKCKITEFKPNSGWMLDEGGGLHSALENKFGKSYCQEKVVTCQMHLSMCRNRHTSSAFIQDDNKQQNVSRFRNLINEMVHASTVNEYNKFYSELRKYITENKKSSLLKWLQWWDKRRNHVMDAYRDILAPNTNLAEVSHASTSHCGGSNLNLIQTAIFDISDCFKYSQLIKGYATGVVKSGAGPSLVKKQKLVSQKSNKLVNTLLDELDNQFKGGKAPSLPSSSTFLSEPTCSHRADKGPTNDKRPIGKKRISGSKQFHLSLEKAKTMTEYTCLDISVHSPMQATVSLCSPSGDIYKIRFEQRSCCSCPFSEIQSSERTGNITCKHRVYLLLCLGYPETSSMVKQYSYTMSEVGDIVNKLYEKCENPSALRLKETLLSNKYSDLKYKYSHLTTNDQFELTYLHGIITKCFGCDKKYTELNRKSPFDLIIKHLEVRPRYNKDKKEWYIPNACEKTNAYYHLQVDCVCKVHPTFKADQIVLSDEMRQTMSTEHKEYLSNVGIDIQ